MRTLFRSLAFPVFLLAATLAPQLLHAQNVVVTGTLSGRVTDPDGSVVPGAQVVARNVATGVEKSSETSSSGLYRLNVLPPGDYSLTVTQKGFRQARTVVRVQVGSTTSQDFELQLGTIEDTVTVHDTTPLLRPTDSSTSTLIDRSFFTELPLNGRKYTNFTLLAPNTSTDGDTGLVSIAGQ